MGFATFRGFPLVTADRVSRHALPLMSFYVYKSILPPRDAVGGSRQGSLLPNSDPKVFVELYAVPSDTPTRGHTEACPRVTPTRLRTEVRQPTD